MRAPSVPPAKDLPAMEPAVVVAGDVHLTPEDPKGAKAFERWVESLRGKVKTLVLLGDVFDYWVGRRQAGEAFPRRILEGLRALQGSGTRLAFLAGNRDFAFDGAEGLEIDVWPDVVRTTWGGRRVVLTHGDLLCTADARYQAMRRVLRSRPARGALAAMPHGAATYLARGLRDLSLRETARKPYASMGIDYGAAKRWLDAYDADVLVAGHVHTGIHHRLEGERPRDVLVLKDWQAGGGVVRFDGNGIDLVPPSQAAGSAPAENR
jgi:UDP-2,3-diacylglucosamine hydrolase